MVDGAVQHWTVMAVTSSRLVRPASPCGRARVGAWSRHGHALFLRGAAAGVWGPWGRMGRVSLYRDEAIVLRTQKLGEADRIITLLTREHGKVRAVGKGVRKTSSRFGSRLEPFMVVDAQLYTGRSLDIVTQVETLGPYAREICADYALYTAGTAMLETAERLVDAEQEPAGQRVEALAGSCHI